jgi:integrase
MDFNETWTISGWYLKSAYRWPISWASAIYLMRLLALIPKRFRTDSFFFGRRYFEEAYDQEADSLIRKPVRKRGGAIVLHDVFSRWLRWLTRLARNDGADIPSDLSLRTAIKAARIRAAMVFAPAVVAYLSGKLPSPPLDDYSWQSIQTGTIEEVGGQSMQMPRRKNGFASVVKPAADLRTPEREQADTYFRHAELILIDGQAHRISKQQVAKSIIQIAEKLPRVPNNDGEQAFFGNIRAALLYAAYRATQLKTRLETLLTELNWLKEVIPHLLGKISLPSLSADELTDLASGYVRSFKSPSTQKQRRASLKRFLSFVQKNSERVLEKGLEMFEPNWNSPDISITWYRKPRRVLTRRHIDELISDGDGKEHDLYPTIFSCLGFYCGMREGEMLALSNRDISHGLTDDLELSYSKTEAGIRRLPVSILIPEPYRELLVGYLHQKDGGRKSKPLIEDGPKSLQKFERQLAKRFGASSHTLRHSAASMMVLKLCLAQNLVSGEPVSVGLEQLRRHLKQTQGEEFSTDSVLAFAEELLGPGWRKSWPMTIPVVSKLLGHLEPGVTVQVYLHVIELIAAHTRDLIEWPPMTQVQAAAMSKTSRTTLIKHLGLSDGELYTAEEIAVYMATRHLPSELFEMQSCPELA